MYTIFKNWKVKKFSHFSDLDDLKRVARIFFYLGHGMFISSGINYSRILSRIHSGTLRCYLISQAQSCLSMLLFVSRPVGTVNVWTRPKDFASFPHMASGRLSLPLQAFSASLCTVYWNDGLQSLRRSPSMFIYPKSKLVPEFLHG